MTTNLPNLADQVENLLRTRDNLQTMARAAKVSGARVLLLCPFQSSVLQGATVCGPRQPRLKNMQPRPRIGYQWHRVDWLGVQRGAGNG